jgi:uncharacterized membrane protein YidH (DUF202 family)
MASKNHLVKLSILFTLFTDASLENIVKGKKVVMIVGIAIMIIGIIFHLQGQSIVGPKSSFMYSNPQWVTYGIQIVVLGSIILVIGAGLGFIKKD